jgi:hypothetical protein
MKGGPPQRRIRACLEIFSLLVKDKTSLPLSKGCLATQRKWLCRRNVDAETPISVEGLNACYSGQGKLSKYSLSMVPLPSIDDAIHTPTHGLAAAHASVLHCVSCSVASLGPRPADLSTSGALDELRGSATGYDGHPTSSCPVSIFPGKVSIPDSSNEPVSLQNLWDFRHSEASGANIIDSFCKHKILPDVIAAQRLQAVGDPKPFSDPLLRQPHKYASSPKMVYH